MCIRDSTTSAHCQDPSGAPDTTRHNEHRTQLPVGCILQPEPCEQAANSLYTANSPDTVNTGQSEHLDAVITGP
eukprot:6890404-Alexandrium_andersonii.AAC.1